jgi:hypothetical protein
VCRDSTLIEFPIDKNLRSRFVSFPDIKQNQNQGLLDPFLLTVDFENGVESAPSYPGTLFEEYGLSSIFVQ